jgi:hypothetical protein
MTDRDELEAELDDWGHRRPSRRRTCRCGNDARGRLATGWPPPPQPRKIAAFRARRPTRNPSVRGIR